MTVGAELSALTGLPLFHNDLSIEAVLPVFAFGSPAFNRLVGGFRERMFAEVVEDCRSWNSAHPDVVGPEGIREHWRPR